ncbi:hypothetical protein M3Y97_00615900 [Aphelenchoides bicaudatus]|nr:hypothetical protein M3Y97_00615900 [Aphelenchoides bicaudatus]
MIHNNLMWGVEVGYRSKQIVGHWGFFNGLMNWCCSKSARFVFAYILDVNGMRILGKRRMQFKFPLKAISCKCSPFGFLISAIFIQLLVLFGAVYTHLDEFINRLNIGRNVTITKNCLEVFTISLSFTSLCWLLKKLIALKYGKVLANNKHICMSVCLVTCLTLILYAFIVTLAVENRSLNLSIYLLLNAATFFIASLSLVVDMIQPENEASDEEVTSNSVSDFKEAPHLKYVEREPIQAVKENRRVSFAHGNARNDQANLNIWALKLEDALNKDDSKMVIAKIVREMRQRSRTPYSKRKSEQLFTEFSYANYCKNNERLIIEED